MSERRLSNSEVVNQELWEKATKVSKGIMRLIWAHTSFYIYPHIEEDLNEYGVHNVYINSYGKFSVRLDDGSEFILIQPCPWLIYELYESKFKIDKGSVCNEETKRKANAYEKFNDFFEYMIFYASRKFC